MISIAILDAPWETVRTLEDWIESVEVPDCEPE